MVKDIILSEDFLYEQPFFYNNELSYRCELGQGDGRTYMKNAKNRALHIFDILFPEKVDALLFHNYYCDYDTSSTDGEHIFYGNIEKAEKDRLVFSIKLQQRYTHSKVRLQGLEPDEDILGVNRIICDNPSQSDCKKYIKRQITNQQNSLLHFVSYDLNCIFSIYDDRGCDIVFFDKDNYLQMYDKLCPCFLEYDLPLIEERVQKAKITY